MLLLLHATAILAMTIKCACAVGKLFHAILHIFLPLTAIPTGVGESSAGEEGDGAETESGTEAVW